MYVLLQDACTGYPHYSIFLLALLFASVCFIMTIESTDPGALPKGA